MEKNTANMPGNILLEWVAPTHPRMKRTVSWYVIASIVFAILILYSLWTHAWTFTFILMLLGGIYAWSHRKEEQKKKISIGEYGFKIGEQFTEWSDCIGYWMLQGPDYIELHFERRRGKPRYCKIQTGDTDIQEIRSVCSLCTAELFDRIERPLDILVRLLKI